MQAPRPAPAGAPGFPGLQALRPAPACRQTPALSHAGAAPCTRPGAAAPGPRSGALPPKTPNLMLPRSARPWLGLCAVRAGWVSPSHPVPGMGGIHSLAPPAPAHGHDNEPLLCRQPQIGVRRGGAPRGGMQGGPAPLAAGLGRAAPAWAPARAWGAQPQPGLPRGPGARSPSLGSRAGLGRAAPAWAPARAWGAPRPTPRPPGASAPRAPPHPRARWAGPRC